MKIFAGITENDHARINKDINEEISEVIPVVNPNIIPYGISGRLYDGIPIKNS